MEFIFEYYFLFSFYMEKKKKRKEKWDRQACDHLWTNYSLPNNKPHILSNWTLLGFAFPLVPFEISGKANWLSPLFIFFLNKRKKSAIHLFRFDIKSLLLSFVFHTKKSFVLTKCNKYVGDSFLLFVKQNFQYI